MIQIFERTREDIMEHLTDGTLNEGMIDMIFDDLEEDYVMNIFGNEQDYL
jgi:hypothetical protein